MQPVPPSREYGLSATPELQGAGSEAKRPLLPPLPFEKPVMLLRAGSRRLCAASASQRTWWATFASFATGSSSSRITTRRSASARSRRCGRRVRGGRPGTGSKLLFSSPMWLRFERSLASWCLGTGCDSRRMSLRESPPPLARMACVVSDSWLARSRISMCVSVSMSRVCLLRATGYLD